MARLSDAAAVARLERALPGFSLTRYGRTTSTQDRALEAARRGAPGWWSCLAAEQTAGRGRLGRSWLAPPGTALLGSVVLRPPAGPGLLTLVAGLAVLDAVTSCGAEGLGLRWPNDVLAGELKLAGVLAEHEPSTGAVVLGIGVNLTVDHLDADVPWTSLHRLVGPAAVPSAVHLWCDLLEALASRLATLSTATGAEAQLRDWRAASVTLGRDVQVGLVGGTVQGRAADVDADGALLLDTAEGRVRVLAGDVRPPR